MKKPSVQALYTEYNEKTDFASGTKAEHALQDALSDLEDRASDDLFWKILDALTDSLEEQKRLAFMAGYNASPKTARAECAAAA